eukprot:8633135-Pyramimonas_sp.AAC.1
MDQQYEWDNEKGLVPIPLKRQEAMQKARDEAHRKERLSRERRPEKQAIVAPSAHHDEHGGKIARMGRT